MASIVENLGNELEQLDKEYASAFAGQSRATRDVDRLDGIIARCASVLERIDQIPSAARGPDLVRLRESAAESLALYKKERAAIVRAQHAGPTFESFAAEATGANLVFSRYGRHFAGKDRSTRDLALLGDLVEELKRIDERMGELLAEHADATFERDRGVVRDNLKRYKEELDLVDTAQKSGTPEQRASVLASLANAQFSVYQVHFSGEPRVSRRPALLMRVISSLKKIHQQMIAFRDEGLKDEHNTKNIGIVEDRLAAYERELGEIRKVRQATPMNEIMGQLGGSANKLFDEYRTAFADKPRTQVDIDKLGNICDKLGEVRRQMIEMSRAEDNEMNAKNLDIVTEQLVMFEGEYEAVLKARAGNGGGGIPTGTA